MKNKSKYLGFDFALKGVLTFFRKERNAKIQLLAAVIAVSVGFYFEIEPTEWLWISLAITLVFVLEMMNTAIELLCDLASPAQNEKAGRLKDMVAGAVLIGSIFSLVVASIIFAPRISALL